MRVLVKLSAAVVLLLVFLSHGAFAAPAAEQAVSAPYTVQLGDTLWDLSAAYHGDPLKWAEVLGANPFLKEKGRVINHPDGRVIVLIRPGEQLAGLERIGVKAEMIPFHNLWPAFVPAAVPTQPAPAAVTDTTASAESVLINLATGKVTTGPIPFYWAPVLGMPLWFLVLAAVLVLVVIWMLYCNGLLFSRRSAAIAGPPIIHGGIAASQQTAIENRFDRIAERRYGERNPQADLAAEHPERISAIESGFLSGIGTVQYRDRAERRRLNHEPAYSARFRFPDGTEENLYFLQLCANDVRLYGTRYSGFRWESERMVVPMAPISVSAGQPTPTPATTGGSWSSVGLPVPLRAVASSTLPTSPVMTTVAVGDIRVTIPGGSSVLVGRDGRITIAVAAACDVVVALAQEAGASGKTAAS